MKKAILLFSIISLSSILSGQELRISIAPTLSNVYHFKYVKSAPYGTVDFGYTGSLDYFLVTKRRIDFGIGLTYQISQVVIWIPDLYDFTSGHERIDLLSLYFKTKFKLSNEFYLSLDPSFDKQINYDRYHFAEDQTGLGLSVGVGRYFRMSDRLSLNIEPRLWIHNLVPFNKLDRPFMLSVAGINIGLVLGHQVTK